MNYDGLSYTEDGRQYNPDLDSYRLGNFKQGWTRAVEGREYESALDELREELFEWCVRQQKESSSR